MKVYFTGSDVLLLNRYPKQVSWRKYPYIWLYRQFIRISKFCTEEYWCVDKHLLPELKRFGIEAEVHPHPFNEEIYQKVEHKEFNILYYCPITNESEKRINDWIYGRDIFERVKYFYKMNCFKINFIEVDGHDDMTKVWPVTDFLLRCNRHDGDARMVKEATYNGIPSFWSYSEPMFEDILKAINKYYYAKFGRHIH